MSADVNLALHDLLEGIGDLSREQTEQRLRIITQKSSALRDEVYKLFLECDKRGENIKCLEENCQELNEYISELENDVEASEVDHMQDEGLLEGADSDIKALIKWGFGAGADPLNVRCHLTPDVSDLVRLNAPPLQVQANRASLVKAAFRMIEVPLEDEMQEF